MEKLPVIADGGDFFPPFCLVQEGTVTFAMQLTGRGQPFEPPNLEATDAAAQIAHLGEELEAIFGIVDAMLTMHRGLRAAGGIRRELRFGDAHKND